MDLEFECTVCGKGFNYETGVGHNNCEPEFCSEDCMASELSTIIDAAYDRMKDDLTSRYRPS